MGSNYFGDRMSKPSSSSFLSSSSRKGKRSGSDQPKQPQRGLGVAQLEKLRLNGQLGSSIDNYASPFLNPYSSSNYNHHQDDMRMQTVYSASSPSAGCGFPDRNNGVLMGFTDLAKSNTACGDSQSTCFTRWIPGNAGVASTQAQHFNVLDYSGNNSTRSFFEQRPYQALLPMINKKNKEGDSESESSQDIDLELRLSLR